MEKFLRLVTLQLLRLLEYYEKKVCDMQSIFTILSSLKTFYNFQWSVSAVWYVHVMCIVQQRKNPFHTFVYDDTFAYLY